MAYRVQYLPVWRPEPAWQAFIEYATIEFALFEQQEREYAFGVPARIVGAPA